MKIKIIFLSLLSAIVISSAKASDSYDSERDYQEDFSPRKRHSLHVQEIPLKEEDSSLEEIEQTFIQKPDWEFSLTDPKPSHLKDTPHNIMITGGQLSKPGAKEKLEDLLRENPEHMVSLCVNKKKVFKGELYLFAGDIPASTRYLWLSNPEGTVKALHDRFLFGHPSLRQVYISEFPKLKTIGKLCFDESEYLRKVHIEAPKLEKIGYSSLLYDADFDIFSKKEPQIVG